MGKKKIAVILVITILAIGGVIGGIVYSFSGTSVSVHDTVLTSNITSEGLINPTYGGFVVSETDISIYNSGVLDIEDITVDVIAYFVSNLTPNSKLKVGEGSNFLGTVAAKETSNKLIRLNLTENIARLAIEDGIIELEFDISLMVQYVPYQLNFQKMAEEPYDAPFPI